ncbi:MAG TPA: ParA family protein [Candidatus Bathyarchaeia archaeon]|nr:ParA family protein [Candidatus Bathyarchaeia archaeon]
MKVISFSIFKGGTGKTTSAVHAAVALAQKEKKVLLVDLDQQASSTRYLNIDPDTVNPNLYHVFTGNVSPATAIKKTEFGIDLLASNSLMAAIEEAMEEGDEEKFSQIITPLRGNYDFILVDSPPGKAMLAFNSLVAADLILVPAAAERMAIDGISDLINHVQNIMWDKYRLDRQEIRILFTMYKATTSHSPGIVKNARKIWRDNVLPMKIPEAIEFPRSYDKKTPLNIYQPKHPGALAYSALADWLIKYEKA